jgi:hypothetical protein
VVATRIDVSGCAIWVGPNSKFFQSADFQIDFRACLEAGVRLDFPAEVWWL